MSARNAVDMRKTLGMMSGRLIDPFNVKRRDFDVRDAAHGLAGQGRYAGQTSSFYSVAEHSYLMSVVAEREVLDEWGNVASATRTNDVLIKQLARDGYGVTPADARELAKWALVHDIEEYLLPDMPSPIKYLPVFAFYVHAGNELRAKLCRWLGLVGPLPEYIDDLDARIRGNEHVYLRPEFPSVKHPRPIPGVIVQGLQPPSAKQVFLNRFIELFPEWKL